MTKQLGFLFGMIFLCGSFLFGAVRRIDVPQAGISPDVAVDNSGKIYLVFGEKAENAHVAYSTGGNAYFAFSTDGGKNFSTPIRLNREPNHVVVGHERGPKIALGKNNAIHVIWMQTGSFSEVMYTRTIDSGKTFSVPRNLRDPIAHVDGAAVASNSHGEVLVAWLDSRLPPDPENPLSLPMFETYSLDNGIHFSKNREVKSSPPVRACSCCSLRARANSAGDFDIAFRGAYNNIRDIFVVQIRPAAGSDAKLVKVADQEWHFEGCPMAGPSIDMGPQKTWVAWMSKGRVYYANSVDNGRDFLSPRTVASAAGGPENHPIILTNDANETFTEWEEKGDVRWQIARADGSIVGQGDSGKLPDGSKATGFVDKGDFCLVF